MTIARWPTTVVDGVHLLDEVMAIVHAVAGMVEEMVDDGLFEKVLLCARWHQSLDYVMLCDPKSIAASSDVKIPSLHEPRIVMQLIAVVLLEKVSHRRVIQSIPHVFFTSESSCSSLILAFVSSSLAVGLPELIL